MAKVLIKNGLVINRGKSAVKDLLIENDRIIKVDNDISDDAARVVDASEKWVMPGIICLLYTSPSPRDQRGSRMPSSA